MNQKYKQISLLAQPDCYGTGSIAGPLRYCHVNLKATSQAKSIPFFSESAPPGCWEGRVFLPQGISDDLTIAIALK